MANMLIQGPLNPKTQGWQLRHNRAVSTARMGAPNESSAIVRALYAWHDYATAYNARYESNIGTDYVLRVGWIEWGRGIRTLLNGVTGPLDCGTLDGFILDTFKENGIEETEL